MSNEKIKQVIVLKKDLPPVGPNNNYIVRYRIVSEDKNRVSHWSQTYNVLAHEKVPVNGSIEITAKSVILVWEDPVGYDDKEAYDIFSKVDDGEWEFRGTSYTHSFTFLKPSGTEIFIAIQNEGYVKKRNDDLTIFEDSELMV